MRPVAHAREHTGSVALGRTQERARQTADNLNEVDATTATLARELRGVLPISMQDADYTLSVEEAKYSRFRLLGVLSVARRLRVPAESDETAREILVINATTGGFAIDVAPSDGATVGNVIAAATRRVLLSASGATVL